MRKSPRSKIDRQLVRTNTQRPRIASIAEIASIKAAPAMRATTAVEGLHHASNNPSAKDSEIPKTIEAIQFPRS